MPRVTYRQHVESISPTILVGDVARRFIAGSLSLVADSIASWSAQALRARLFNDPAQPTDALSLQGEERLSPRYAVDTDATYRARLRSAWDRWKQGGSEIGMLAELAAYGLAAEIVLNSEWDWDGDATNWSRFWVVLVSHPWTPPPDLGDPGLALDGTWTLGSSATPEEVDTVRKIVRRWKPGHMACANIILVFDTDGWPSNQPDGTWDNPLNRFEDACYWHG